MLTKKQVLSAVKNIPDDFDTTQLFDRTLLINKIEEGRQQIKDGKGISTEKAKNRFDMQKRLFWKNIPCPEGWSRTRDKINSPGFMWALQNHL